MGFDAPKIAPQTTHTWPLRACPLEALGRPIVEGVEVAGGATGAAVTGGMLLLRSSRRTFKDEPGLRHPVGHANQIRGTKMSGFVVTLMEGTMTTMTAEEVADELRRSNKWTEDPREFPTMRAVSPGMLNFRRVLVYRGTQPRLEFLTFHMPSTRMLNEEVGQIMWKVLQWNMQWEAGPYRAFDTDDLPKPLAFLRDLQTLDQPTTDIVLVPRQSDNIYDAWAPLYHLLPRGLLQKFDLPIIPRGMWPRGLAPWAERIRPDQQEMLEQALARHLWAHGMGRTKSPLAAFSDTDPLKLLSHDLSFWRAHMEVLLRDYGGTHGRVVRQDGDSDPESIPLDRPDVSFEMPRFGCEVWAGEEEAAGVTRDLIDVADERGRAH